jgi:hypothetical protein
MSSAFVVFVIPCDAIDHTAVATGMIPGVISVASGVGSSGSLEILSAERKFDPAVDSSSLAPVCGFRFRKQISQSSPGSGKPRHYGPFGALQQIGDLLIREAIVFPQYDDFAEIPGEVINRPAHSFAFILPNTECVGIRRLFDNTIEIAGVKADNLPCCARSTHLVEPDVSQDSEQPAFGITIGAQRLSRRERTKICLLNKISRCGGISRHDQRVTIQSIHVTQQVRVFGLFYHLEQRSIPILAIYLPYPQITPALGLSRKLSVH